MSLTERQADVLAFIEVFMMRNGFSPSIREISDGMGVQLQAIHTHLRKLRTAGAITFEDRKERTIQVVAGTQ
ncbi:MAG: LexA binding domain [Verrucomicrobiota bacterium]|jgi:repressor LexA